MTEASDRFPSLRTALWSVGTILISVLLSGAVSWQVAKWETGRVRQQEVADRRAEILANISDLNGLIILTRSNLNLISIDAAVEIARQQAKGQDIGALGLNRLDATSELAVKLDEYRSRLASELNRASYFFPQPVAGKASAVSEHVRHMPSPVVDWRDLLDARVTEYRGGRLRTADGEDVTDRFAARGVDPRFRELVDDLYAEMIKQYLASPGRTGP